MHPVNRKIIFPLQILLSCRQCSKCRANAELTAQRRPSMHSIARVYVWNIECLYFSLDEALGLFSLLLQFLIRLLVYDFIRFMNINWD